MNVEPPAGLSFENLRPCLTFGQGYEAHQLLGQGYPDQVSPYKCKMRSNRDMRVVRFYQQSNARSWSKWKLYLGQFSQVSLSYQNNYTRKWDTFKQLFPFFIYIITSFVFSKQFFKFSKNLSYVLQFDFFLLITRIILFFRVLFGTLYWLSVTHSFATRHRISRNELHCSESCDKLCYTPRQLVFKVF